MRNKRKLVKKVVARTVVIGFFVLLFFIGIILWYYIQVCAEKRENIIKEGRIMASRSADQFENYLSTNIDLINFTAYTLNEMITENRSDDEIQDFIVAQSTAVKNAVDENSTGLYGYIKGVFHSGTNWIPPEDYDATERPWYTKPLGNPGEIMILEPYVDVQSGNTMLALGKTLSDRKSVISIDVSLDHMQKLTEMAVLDGDSDIEMILTADGTVVTHSEKSEVGKNYTYLSNSLGGKVLAGLAGENENYFEFEFGGVNYIVYDALFQGEWHCVSVQEATSVFGSLNGVLVLTVIIVLMLVIAVGVLLYNYIKSAIVTEGALASSEAKSEFMSNMSHEIRTPINVMIGMNEMIFREAEDERIIRYAERAKEAGKMLLGFVDDILRYSLNEDKIQLEESEETAQTIERKKGERVLAPSANILAVDDNPMNLMVLSSLLKETGASVVTAGSGDEALELTKETKFDIIFMDHMMPDKDGIQTFHEMREQKRNLNINTPTICLTANAISGVKEKYLSEGFDDYMSKPVDVELLEDILQRFLPGNKIEGYVKCDDADSSEDSEFELPEELAPLEGLRQINPELGIKNSGDVEDYIRLLKIFYSSMDEKIDELEGFYREGDLKNYTVKVHALKSSARLIGAVDFADDAQVMENAGKSEDEVYIRDNHEKLMNDYRNFKYPLMKLFPENEDNGKKPLADDKKMKEVYRELRDAADDMDCDRLQEAFADMERFGIPEEEAELWGKLSRASDNYDYEGILSLLESKDLT